MALLAATVFSLLYFAQLLVGVQVGTCTAGDSDNFVATVLLGCVLSLAATAAFLAAGRPASRVRVVSLLTPAACLVAAVLLCVKFGGTLFASGHLCGTGRELLAGESHAFFLPCHLGMMVCMSLAAFRVARGPRPEDPEAPDRLGAGQWTW